MSGQQTYSFRSSSFGRRRYGGGGRRFPSGGGHSSYRSQHKFDLSLLVKRTEGYTDPAEYQPEHSFGDFAISEKLKENIALRGYKTVTPIQDQAIPHLLLGRDVVGTSNTGTGKTAAFLIPLLNKINSDRSQRVLIVTPTRELAAQIQEECLAFSRNMNIFSQLCIGGVSLMGQIRGLRRNPHLVIGTPGRLRDLNNQRYLNFSDYSSIVLDEVDRMLDMGFIHDVEFIVSHLPKVRQSLFFSATISYEIGNIMQTFCNNPVMISIKPQATALNVDQDIVKVNGQGKLDLLHDLLIQEGFDKVLVFGRTKRGIERLARQLSERGFAIAALHGNKSQNQRQRALAEFKQNKVNILLATDIAARGLDIENVTHVINYDLPETYDDYVHRIGRTGRANKKGIALSFVD